MNVRIGNKVKYRNGRGMATGVLIGRAPGGGDGVRIRTRNGHEVRRKAEGVVPASGGRATGGKWTSGAVTCRVGGAV